MKKLLLVLLIGCCAQAMEQQYPLHEAAKSGNLAQVIDLVENQNFDPNIKDSKGYTPLHKAAWYAHKDVATYLIKQSKRPIDITIKNEDKDTAVQYLAWNGFKDLITYLLEESNHVIDINDRGNDGATLLQAAAHQGHNDLVTYLIEQQKQVIDTNIKNDMGNTALHIAIMAKHNNIALYLIKQQIHPVDITIQNNHGMAPLHLAVQHGLIDIVDLLIKQPKCDLNIQDNEGYTPLHNAARYKHKDIVTYLIKQSVHPIDIDIKNNYGSTALYIAAKVTEPLTGDSSIVKILLFYGADLSISNNDKKYPFEVAETEELEKLLTPSNPEEFKKNPEDYQKKHSDEFNPVVRFPDEFKELRKKEIVEKTNGQNAVTYLLRRELGFPKNYSPRVSHNPSEQSAPELTKDWSQLNIE